MKQSDRKIQIDEIVEQDFQPVFPSLINFDNLRVEPLLPPLIINDVKIKENENLYTLDLTFSIASFQDSSDNLVQNSRKLYTVDETTDTDTYLMTDKNVSHNNNHDGKPHSDIEIDRRIDVYLIINDIKYDVFYKIKKGIFSFNNIILPTTTNYREMNSIDDNTMSHKIELFYVLGNKRSMKQKIII